MSIQLAEVTQNPNAISTAPNTCPTCGEIWSAGEQLVTGDQNAFKGIEDWRYCAACGEELFYPMEQSKMLANNQSAESAGR